MTSFHASLESVKDEWNACWQGSPFPWHHWALMYEIEKQTREHMHNYYVVSVQGPTRQLVFAIRQHDDGAWRFAYEDLFCVTGHGFSSLEWEFLLSVLPRPFLVDDNALTPVITPWFVPVPSYRFPVCASMEEYLGSLRHKVRYKFRRLLEKHSHLTTSSASSLETGVEREYVARMQQEKGSSYTRISAGHAVLFRHLFLLGSPQMVQVNLYDGYKGPVVAVSRGIRLLDTARGQDVVACYRQAVAPHIDPGIGSLLVLHMMNHARSLGVTHMDLGGQSEDVKMYEYKNAFLVAGHTFTTSVAAIFLEGDVIPPNLQPPFLVGDTVVMDDL